MTTEQCFVIPEDAQAEPAVVEAPPAPAEKPSALPDNKTLAAFGLFILLAGGASVAVRITYGVPCTVGVGNAVGATKVYLITILEIIDGALAISCRLCGIEPLSR